MSICRPQASTLRESWPCRRRPTRHTTSPPETYLGYQRAENFASTGGLAQDPAQTLLRSRVARPESLGIGGIVVGGSREGGVGRRTGENCVSVFCARFASRCRSGQRRQAGAVSRDVGRRGASCKSRRGHRCRRPGRDSGTTSVSTDSPVRRCARACVFIEFLDDGVQAYSFTFG